MAKIVIDARMLRTSTGRYIDRLLQYLQEIDHTHRYVVLLKPKDMDSWTPTNRKFKKVACRHKEFTFAEQLGMWRQLRRLKADLVHFTMTQQPILYRGKTVTTIHDLTATRFRNPSKNRLIYTLKRWVYSWLIKIVAHTSKAVITDTAYTKDELAKYARINSRKITPIYLATDKITDPPEPMKLLMHKDFLLYVGRPMPHKNLERLVEAFGLLKETHFNLTLVLAGKLDSNYRRLKRLVDEKNIPGVFFSDFVTDGELRWLYEHALAYVFPSLSEGFGLPGLEAMMHGCPVVSSNATTLPEVYKDAAHYFDPMDVSDIAGKINDVLADAKLAQRLVVKGSLLAKDYSWARTAKQTLDIYKTVLGERVAHASSDSSRAT
jgi:glycosyltransferase involved in cell wall biosynthesis